MDEQFYIIRCKNAGVFFGKIKERVGKDEVTLTNVRKIWYWSGAAAVEQLAITGPRNGANCKITIEVPEMTVMEPIQIIPCTDEARNTIQRITVWKI